MTSSLKILCSCILLGASQLKGLILQQSGLSYRRQRRHGRRACLLLRHPSRPRSHRRLDTYRIQTLPNALFKLTNQITKSPDHENSTEENLPSKARLAAVSISKSETSSRAIFRNIRGSIISRPYRRHSCRATCFSCSASFRKRRRIMRRDSGPSKWSDCSERRISPAPSRKCGPRRWI